MKQHLIDPEICIRCYTCEMTCPIQAIQHDDVVAAGYSLDGLRILTESDGSLQLRDATTGEAIGQPFPGQNPKTGLRPSVARPPG